MNRMMTQCPHCKTEFEAEKDWIGQTVPCPVCNHTFSVIIRVKPVSIPKNEPKTVPDEAEEAGRIDPEYEETEKPASEETRVQEWDPAKFEEIVTKKKRLRRITIIVISVIFVVLLAVVGFTVVLPRLYIGNELSAARDAMEWDDWDKVLKHAGNVLAKTPENDEAKKLRDAAEIQSELAAAREALESSDWDKVLEHAGNVLAKDPENGEAKVFRNGYTAKKLSAAREARDSSDWDKVLEHAGNVLAQDPENDEAKALRNAAVNIQSELAAARKAKESSEWGEVLEHAGNVLTKDPENDEAKALRDTAEIQSELAAARKAKEASEWGEVLEHANNVLKKDSENDEAKALRDTAESIQSELAAARKADVSMQSVNLTASVSNSAPKLSGLYAARSAGSRMVALKRYGGNNQTEAAVQKALKWLASVQNEDGTWGDTAPEYARWKVQLTCLALLAYLAHGDSPQTPEYGENILRGLKKVTEWAEKSWTTDPEKFINGDVNAHARMCIVLAEGYALTGDPALERAMNKAVSALLKEWTKEKPWGMNPIGGYLSLWSPARKETIHTSDLDRESRVYNALYSAYAAGCEVPGLKEKIELAIKNMSTNHKAADGGFNYRMVKGAKGTKGTFEGTAVGTFCLYLMGGKSPAAREGLAWLEWYRPGDKDNSRLKMDWKNLPGTMSILGWYYMTQALFLGYDGKGLNWQRWNKSMINSLVKEQDPKGFWPCPADKYPVYVMTPRKDDEGEIIRDKNGQPKMEKTERVMPESSYGGFCKLNGRIWATVYFCMCLEVYYRYLPTFKVKDKPVKPGTAASADRLQQIVTENRELLDRPLPENAAAARILLDRKINFLESIVRDFEGQRESQLYQGLKKEKERLQGLRAMYEE